MKSKEIMMRFPLTKGGGNLPPQRHEISEVEIKDFRPCITLNICWEPFQLDEEYQDLKVKGFEILYDGCTPIDGKRFGYHIDEDGLVGYPAPIIRFWVDKPIDPEDFARGMRETSMNITTESQKRLGKSPFYAEDHNGYSAALEEEERDDWSEIVSDVDIFSGYREDFPHGMIESGYQVAGKDFIVSPILVVG